MATPERARDEERATVVDIAAIERGRDRTSAALERLSRAGAEAQAELALLRAQQHEPPARRAVPPGRDEAPSIRLRAASPPVAPHVAAAPARHDDTDRLRSVTSVLHQEHDATLALTEAVRTELSVLYQAKGVAEAERDAAMAQVDSMRVEAANERARVRAEHERVIAQLAAYEARVREELAVLEAQVGAQQDQLT
ncbi:MAG TPA: hypothetical protein VMU14_10280, partial [Acidimicrobiales bacterium]|nr:hypothetical protein [Acidimicrobiales bacterium]